MMRLQLPNGQDASLFGLLGLTAAWVGTAIGGLFLVFSLSGPAEITVAGFALAALLYGIGTRIYRQFVHYDNDGDPHDSSYVVGYECEALEPALGPGVGDPSA
jgi:ABC-type uncharacterized transport system permease subunit